MDTSKNVAWLDMPILSLLPPQGSKVGQFRPLTITVRGIRNRLNDEFSSDEIAARLRAMREQGQVIDVSLASLEGPKGWQITPTGVEILAALKQEVK